MSVTFRKELDRKLVESLMTVDLNDHPFFSIVADDLKNDGIFVKVTETVSRDETDEDTIVVYGTTNTLAEAKTLYEKMGIVWEDEFLVS